MLRPFLPPRRRRLFPRHLWRLLRLRRRRHRPPRRKHRPPRLSVRLPEAAGKKQHDIKKIRIRKDLMRIFFFLQLIDLIRKKRDVTCSLDRNSQSSLVLCAVAGDAARKDLASLRDVLSQSSGVLIIDRLRVLCAEHTDFSSSAHSTRLSCSRCCGSFALVKRHFIIPLQISARQAKPAVLLS